MNTLNATYGRKTTCFKNLPEVVVVLAVLQQPGLKTVKSVYLNGLVATQVLNYRPFIRF